MELPPTIYAITTHLPRVKLSECSATALALAVVFSRGSLYALTVIIRLVSIYSPPFSCMINCLFRKLANKTDGQMLFLWLWCAAILTTPHSFVRHCLPDFPFFVVATPMTTPQRFPITITISGSNSDDGGSGWRCTPKVADSLYSAAAAFPC